MEVKAFWLFCILRKRTTSVSGFAKVVKVCHGGVGGHETSRGVTLAREEEVAPGKGGKLWRLLLLLLLLVLHHHHTSQLTQEGFQGSRETQASPWPKGRGYKAECPPCFEREGRRTWRTHNGERQLQHRRNRSKPVCREECRCCQWTGSNSQPDNLIES